MTLPQEQVHSIVMCERFLTDLVTGKIKRTPEIVKESARRILRHFPTELEARRAFLGREEMNKWILDGKTPIEC